MEAAEGGVLLSDVRAESPAARAGIRGGDRIVGLAGTKIANLYDMTYALQEHKPGDAVDVVVMRGGERRHPARRPRRAGRGPRRAGRVTGSCPRGRGACRSAARAGQTGGRSFL